MNDRQEPISAREPSTAAPAGEPASSADDDALTARAASSATGADDAGASGRPTPTTAQLRRFIKSRPYVPMHELRRRFEVNGEMDEVCPILVPDGLTVYVGLPEQEARCLGELARDGEIGLELSRDPQVPIVVGVFAMKPVARS